MKNSLKKILQFEKILKDLNYPDSYRVSREIVEFLNNKNISERNLIQRLSSNEPWEYIKESVEFCGLNFKVTKDTLIPRVETEQLVYECKDIIQRNKIKNIIDIGTGSGCIIISLVSLLMDTTPYSFYATDISARALNIAKKNEEKILKKKRINWYKGNLIENIPILSDKSIIIANLPYIPTKQYMDLDNSVKDFEPRDALDGGKNGLKYYKQLLEQLKERNHNIYTICIETEESIFSQTRNLLKEYYPTSTIRELKDTYERNRFLICFL